MTDVNKSNTRKISSVDEALSLYAPPPEKYHGKVGLEVEMPLFRPGPGKPEIPSAAVMLQMQDDLKRQGFDAQLEAAGVLEYASPPVPLANTADLVRRAEKDIADFTATAASYGFSRAPFCVLPTTTQGEALENAVPRERLQASLSAMRQIFDPEACNIPLLTTGVQTSFSPKDPDQMFRMMYRAYALTPLLVAAMNSFSGFTANDPERKDIHYRAKMYECYGAAGGIAESFLKSSCGTDLIRNHIEAVFKTPMHFAYDAAGEILSSTRDNIMTFEKLIQAGLNTQANYELAESFIYNDVKICNLRDEKNVVVGKRLEVRAADAGFHQAASTLLMTAALVPDGETAGAFDRLLKDYGFTGYPPADAALFTASRKAAVEHDGCFMEVPFGTGNLRDFAADVAGLLVAHYDGQSASPEVAHLADILLTGNCDAKIHARTLPTLREVTEALQGAAAVPAAGAKAAREFRRQP